MCSTRVDQALGLFALHENGVVHANLKPDGIYVEEDGHILISEFENATFLRDGSLLLPGKSTEEMKYHAPELVLGWDYEYSADWWSYGLLLCWISTGEVSRQPLRHIK